MGKRKAEKPTGGTGISGHIKVKNPQLEREDSGSEVLEEDQKKGKDEQGIRIGAKENVK